MNAENTRAGQDEAGRAAPGEPNPTDAVGCCDPMTAEMMQECPCGTFFKEHRLAGLVIFSLAILALLISQVGGILGIIAFFRTM